MIFPTPIPFQNSYQIIEKLEQLSNFQAIKMRKYLELLAASYPYQSAALPCWGFTSTPVFPATYMLSAQHVRLTDQTSPPLSIFIICPLQNLTIKVLLPWEASWTLKSAPCVSVSHATCPAQGCPHVECEPPNKGCWGWTAGDSCFECKSSQSHAKQRNTW